MVSLDRANEIRIERARQRRELVHAPIQVVVPALIDPTPELGTYKLGVLIAPPSSKAGATQGVIRRVGKYALEEAIREVEGQRPFGRRSWSLDLRLNELTRQERQRLARALAQRAPRAWRKAA